MPAFGRTLGFHCLAITLLSAQPERRGDVYAYVDSTIDAMPAGVGTNDYLPPTPGQFDVFQSVVEDLFEGRPESATSSAGEIGYRVIFFVDTTQATDTRHLLLERHPDSSQFWGTVIVAIDAERPDLVLQCPHPLFDTKSAHQGAWIYRLVGARALVISGAHRCNSVLASPCAGTTTVCSGVTEPFRRSDPAHNVDHPMQAATFAIMSSIAQPTVVQLHGFGKDPGDPDLILSNGTRATPATDPVTRLRDRLLEVDDSLTFKIAHIDTTWNVLTGTTNVQGRLLNGSPSPCTQSASLSEGRFIHMEQAYARLRDNVSSWTRVAAAFASAFPASPTRADAPVHPVDPELRVDAYPNPFNPATIIRFHLPHPARVQAFAYELTGRHLGPIFDGRYGAGQHQRSWEPRLPSGTYLCRIIAIPEDGRRPPLERTIKLLLVR